MPEQNAGFPRITEPGEIEPWHGRLPASRRAPVAVLHRPRQRGDLAFLPGANRPTPRSGRVESPSRVIFTVSLSRRSLADAQRIEHRVRRRGRQRTHRGRGGQPVRGLVLVPGHSGPYFSGGGHDRDDHYQAPEQDHHQRHEERSSLYGSSPYSPRIVEMELERIAAALLIRKARCATRSGAMVETPAESNAVIRKPSEVDGADRPAG